jgi:GntR family transcriptional regulator/MocR family aminotransferase
VLTRGRGRGLRAQLEDQLRSAVRGGVLQPGARLPSTRTLATDLGVSRRLVVDAYDQLVAEGYLSTRPGGRTFVSDVAPGREYRGDRQWQIAFDLLPGTPDLAAFPRTAWARAHSSVLRTAANDALRYPDPAGAWILRTALAAYLSRVRSVRADPDRIVICSGVREGLALLVSVLRRNREPLIGLEDPGIFEGKAIVEAAGGRVRPLPVDELGVRVDELEGLDAVVVTPAHQFPTGVKLDQGRRSALIRWSSGGGFIVEDDYDAEYRYDRAPIPALHSAAEDRVVYLGSVSKTLAPALRLGWMVAPPDLVEGIVRAKSLHDAGTSVLLQLAFAEFLDQGEYDRHLRMARRRYRSTRETLIAAFAKFLPELEILGAEGGIHLTARLPRAIDGRALRAAAHRRGLEIALVEEFQIRPFQGQALLVIGYGNLPDASAEPAIRLLASTVRELR